MSYITIPELDLNYIHTLLPPNWYSHKSTSWFPYEDEYTQWTFKDEDTNHLFIKDGKFTIDLPGFNKEEINISIENGIISIEANNLDRTVSKTYEPHVALNGITADDIICNLKNGVLHFLIVKRQPVVNTKITIG